jgi:hypothetical protein
VSWLRGGHGLVIAPLTQDDDGVDAEVEFLAGEYATNIFEPLQDAVDIGEVLPDEVADTRILRDGLVGAVEILIAGDQTFYSYIVNKQNGE